MLDQGTAARIWNCINWHDGFAEDRSEWKDSLGIQTDDLEAFDIIVWDAIKQLPVVDDGR